MLERKCTLGSGLFNLASGKYYLRQINTNEEIHYDVERGLYTLKNGTSIGKFSDVLEHFNCAPTASNFVLCYSE